MRSVRNYSCTCGVLRSLSTRHSTGIRSDPKLRRSVNLTGPRNSPSPTSSKTYEMMEQSLHRSTICLFPVDNPERLLPLPFFFPRVLLHPLSPFLFFFCLSPYTVSLCSSLLSFNEGAIQSLWIIHFALMLH